MRRPPDPARKAKDDPVRLPPIEGSLADAGRCVLDALGRGMLGPDDAGTVMAAIASQVRIVEAVIGAGACPAEGCGRCPVRALLAASRGEPLPTCDARPGTGYDELLMYTVAERQALRAAIEAEKERRKAATLERPLDSRLAPFVAVERGAFDPTAFDVEGVNETLRRFKL